MKNYAKSAKWLAIVLIVLSFVACKKEQNNDEIEQIIKLENLNKKIQDIIPAQYLDSLKKLGLTINQGTTPVNVEGYYAVDPLLLQATNVTGDYAIGHKFNDARIKLFSQEENFSIKLIAKKFLSTSDTSIVTAISGTGNDITIYGKVKSVQSGKTAESAIVISATIANKTLTNFKYGLIIISNKNETVGNPFIKEGQGRVIYESDAISTIITESQFGLATTKINEGIMLQSGGSFNSILAP